MVEIIDLRGTMRVSGSDPLLHRSPLSSGQTTPCSSSICSSPEPQMQDADMQERSPSPLSIPLPNTTSSIAGGLPAKYTTIPTATSPSLGFEMTTKFNEVRPALCLKLIMLKMRYVNCVFLLQNYSHAYTSPLHVISGDSRCVRTEP